MVKIQCGDIFIDYRIGDCLDLMRDMDDYSIDSIVTDPPYGISFMGKDWDKALPSIDIWKECLRVLKPGGFAFVMSIPRSDCLSRMIILLEDAGFNVAFSPIYWTFASGFPKAQNMSKAIDKRFGVERTKIKATGGLHKNENLNDDGWCKIGDDNALMDCNEAVTQQAKCYDGWYTYNPKPAVEVIIVAMKPLSEKSYIDQALRSYDDDSVGSGCVNFDDCRIPSTATVTTHSRGANKAFPKRPLERTVEESGRKKRQDFVVSNPHNSRFPANLLCSDDVLNDGTNHTSGKMNCTAKGTLKTNSNTYGVYGSHSAINNKTEGSFSRFFDIDSWWEHKIKSLPESIQKTFPFLITPKSPQKERCFYCHICEQAYPMVERGNHKDHAMHCDDCDVDYSPEYKRVKKNAWEGRNVNLNKRPSHFIDDHRNHNTHSNFFTHPTQKPLKLFSYLITLGSRVGDTILDPFGGTGTTPVACKMLNRNCISTDLEPLCEKIVEKRLNISKSKSGNLYIRETKRLC